MGRLTLAALAVVLAAMPAYAATPYAWVQYAAGGVAEARVVTDDPACPAVTVDGASLATSERHVPDQAFPIRVCSVRLPAGAAAVSLGDRRLPVPVARPQKIVVLGDTGCRLKFIAVQACNDPAEWPFARVAAAAAREKPDLVIHVGDYNYRETPCPPGVAGCAGSVYGDNWATWQVDFMAPAQPLLAAAPWVAIRGNHEDCERAWLGWTALLLPDPATATCAIHAAAFSVDIGGLRLLALDDSGAIDTKLYPPVTDALRADLAAAATGTIPTWVVTHHPIHGLARANTGGNVNLIAASQGLVMPAVQLNLSGHIHAFQEQNFQSGYPPQLVVGTGGTRLDMDAPPNMAGQASSGVVVRDGLSLPEFGYVVMERQGEAWSIVMHDPDGTVRRSCRLAGGRIDC